MLFLLFFCYTKLCSYYTKLDNLAWLLNLRAMDIQCTPYAMAYCYVTPDKATLFINTARVSAEAAAELKENGVELAEYDDVLTVLAAQTEEQTVLADPVSVNYAVYPVSYTHLDVYKRQGADGVLRMQKGHGTAVSFFVLSDRTYQN